MNNKEQREKHVRNMLKNNELEGIKPDSSDLIAFQSYIEGNTSLKDLLDRAQLFAERHTNH